MNNIRVCIILILLPYHLSELAILSFYFFKKIYVYNFSDSFFATHLFVSLNKKYMSPLDFVLEHIIYAWTFIIINKKVEGKKILERRLSLNKYIKTRPTLFLWPLGVTWSFLFFFDYFGKCLAEISVSLATRPEFWAIASSPSS